MASFSVEVESILDIDKIENVLIIAQWIKNCMMKAGQKIKSYKFRILFTSGKLKVTCNSEKEFKEYSLGQEFSVITYSIFFNVLSANSVSFFIEEKRGSAEVACISVHSDDRSILQEVTSVMKASREEFAKHQSLQFSEIEIQSDFMQSEMINTDNSNKNSHAQAHEKKQPGFWHGVLQIIVSNIIWVILIAIIIILITVLGITQPDWLRF